MRTSRHAAAFLLCGLALVLLGLASWGAGLDLVLHRPLRLAAALSVPRGVIRLSALGGLAVMGPIALAAVAMLAIMRRWRDAIWLLATIASGRVAVELLKDLVHRARPPLADRLATVGGASFPSSHSAGTMMTCLALAVLAGGGAPVTVAALAVAAVIGWSRLALAVHWPGDVLAGWGFGMAWVGAAMTARR